MPTTFWPPGTATFSEDQDLPAGVDEGAAEGQTVHRLVQQPIKDHLAVPRADGHPQLGSAPLAQVVVVADGGEEADHLHVEGDGRAQADGRQLIGHLLPVDKHGTWTSGHDSAKTHLDRPGRYWGKKKLNPKLTIGGDADSLVPLQ